MVWDRRYGVKGLGAQVSVEIVAVSWMKAPDQRLGYVILPVAMGVLAYRVRIRLRLINLHLYCGLRVRSLSWRHQSAGPLVA